MTLHDIQPDEINTLIAWRQAFAPQVVGECGLLRAALDVARRASDTDCPILLRGETGTGKELFAEALHHSSPRSEGPFVAVNCASIPDSLLESELFGHVKGAFTGASGVRKGMFLGADGGTLFLDEVGELSLSAQAKLLRVLQTGRISQVGADSTVAVDVRVIAATHRDLEAMVREGTFRQDLYFRLAVIPVQLPALRERGQDIVDLAHYFMLEANRKHRRSVDGFAPGAVEALCGYEWPGNVRELANVVQRAVIMRSEGTVSPSDLGLPANTVGSAMRTMAPVVTNPSLQAVSSSVEAVADAGIELNLRDALVRVERHLIERALERADGNKTEAAALLGLNRTTLVEKIRRISSVAA